MSIQEEIKQTKPFSSLEEEALLNIARTFHTVSLPFSNAIQKYDLTGQQYNVLRIMRGAGAQGLPCGEISNRMITCDSDITRLLDRLDKGEYIKRYRPETDRRVVIAQITEKGKEILVELDEPLKELHRKLLGKMKRENLKTLISLLEEVRSQQ